METVSHILSDCKALDRKNFGILTNYRVTKETYKEHLVDSYRFVLDTKMIKKDPDVVNPRLNGIRLINVRQVALHIIWIVLLRNVMKLFISISVPYNH